MIMMVSYQADDLEIGRDTGLVYVGHDVHRGSPRHFGSMPWLERANRKTSAPERLDKEATAVCGLYVIHGSDDHTVARCEVRGHCQAALPEIWKPIHNEAYRRRRISKPERSIRRKARVPAAMACIHENRKQARRDRTLNVCRRVADQPRQ